MSDSLLALLKYLYIIFCMVKHTVLKCHNTCPPIVILRKMRAFEYLAILLPFRELMILFKALTEPAAVRKRVLGTILKGPGPEAKGKVTIPAVIWKRLFMPLHSQLCQCQSGR